MPELVHIGRRGRASWTRELIELPTSSSTSWTTSLLRRPSQFLLSYMVREIGNSHLLVLKIWHNCRPLVLKNLVEHIVGDLFFVSVLHISPPKILEPLRRELGVAHRVHDVFVPEVVLQGARVASVVGEFVAARVPQHVRVHGKRKLCGHRERARNLRKPAGVIGAPRSVMNTKRPALSSRLSARSARISSPPICCTDAIPFLTRRTCIMPWEKSTWSQVSEQSSETRSPCRYATRSSSRRASRSDGPASWRR